MEDPKIGWKRREGENAWMGVRGRFKFFTLRIVESQEITEAEAGNHDWPFLLVYHMDNGRQEHLEPMPLSAAQAVAERELDTWLYKAGLTEGKQLTPVQHEINSAMTIIDACVEDGIRGLVTEYERERFAERIALFNVLSTLTELSRLRLADDPEKVEFDERVEQLRDIMLKLKEIV